MWRVKVSSITNGFKKAEILGLQADDSSGETTEESSSSEGENQNEADRMAAMADEEILKLFVSDTEDSDFAGFTADD